MVTEPPVALRAPPADKAGADKAAGAYRTIGELSRETGLPQHILRYWETRFPQLRPLQRAGRRRYYRPEDVALVRRIAALLAQDGYTLRGVQKQLQAASRRDAPAAIVVPDPIGEVSATTQHAILAVRDTLAAALAEDVR